jgi:hypothetical protein
MDETQVTVRQAIVETIRATLADWTGASPEVTVARAEETADRILMIIATALTDVGVPAKP